MRRTATISECGRYRYALGRRWADWEDGDTVCWVMLNPSTADAAVDDPTVRRCINYSRAWGFGALTVVNLYALRSPDPAALALAEDPVGPANNMLLGDAASLASLVIAAWGAHPMARLRLPEVLDVFDELGVVLDCLGTTASGAPCHPGRLRNGLEPVRWPRAD